MKKRILPELFGYIELIESLVYRAIVSRYKQSILGLLWSIGKPIAMATIYTVVFSFIAKFPSEGVPYPLFVFGALLPWNFLSVGLSSTVPSLVAHSNLVTKVYFPREIIPLSMLIASLIDTIITFVILLLMMVYFKVPITLYSLYIFPILLIELLLIFGLSLILAMLNVWFRDIQHALSLLIQLWMYLTPVIYPLSMVPEKYLPIYTLNPMVGILDNFRKVVIHGSPPDLNLLALSAIVSIFSFLLGYGIFKAKEHQFADHI